MTTARAALRAALQQGDRAEVLRALPRAKTLGLITWAAYRAAPQRHHYPTDQHHTEAMRRHLLTHTKEPA